MLRGQKSQGHLRNLWAAPSLGLVSQIPEYGPQASLAPRLDTQKEERQHPLCLVQPPTSVQKDQDEI